MNLGIFGQTGGLFGGLFGGQANGGNHQNLLGTLFGGHEAPANNDILTNTVNALTGNLLNGGAQANNNEQEAEPAETAVTTDEGNDNLPVWHAGGTTAHLQPAVVEPTQQLLGNGGLFTPLSPQPNYVVLPDANGGNTYWYAPSEYQIAPYQYAPTQYQPTQYQATQFQPFQYQPNQYQQTQFQPTQFQQFQYQPAQYQPIQYITPYQQDNYFI